MIYFLWRIISFHHHKILAQTLIDTIRDPMTPRRSRCFLNLPPLPRGVSGLLPFTRRGCHATTIIGSSFVGASFLRTPPYLSTPFMTPLGIPHTTPLNSPQDTHRGSSLDTSPQRSPLHIVIQNYFSMADKLQISFLASLNLSDLSKLNNDAITHS